jgi:hypothetical protein
MAQYRMLETMTGSNDGIKVHLFQAGEVYGPESEPPMHQVLADVLVQYGHAEEVQNVDEEAAAGAGEEGQGAEVDPTAEGTEAAKRKTKVAGPSETKQETGE